MRRLADERGCFSETGLRTVPPKAHELKAALAPNKDSRSTGYHIRVSGEGLSLSTDR